MSETKNPEGLSEDANKPTQAPDPLSNKRKSVRVREKKVAKEMVINGLSATEAVLKVYNPGSKRNARVMASQIVSRPSTQGYIEQELTRLYPDHRAIMVQTIMDAMLNADRTGDRLKAVQMLADLLGYGPSTRQEKVTKVIPPGLPEE